MKFSFSSFPVIFYGITGDIPAMRLKTIIEDEVAPRLERIDGVASARVFSMDEREILVDVDKASLESRGLTLDQIRMALGAENLNLPAGNLVERHSEILVRTMGEFAGLDDIRRTVVGMTATGEPVYVADVAEVKDTLKEMRYAARIQGQNGVYLIVSKRSGANTQQTSSAVKKELAALGDDPRQSGLPRRHGPGRHDRTGDDATRSPTPGRADCWPSSSSSFSSATGGRRSSSAWPSPFPSSPPSSPSTPPATP